MTIQSSSVKSIPKTAEIPPTDGTRPQGNSQSNLWNSGSNIRQNQTLPHWRSSGETSVGPPTFPKKSIREGFVSPPYTKAITKLSIVHEQEKSEHKSMDCCFRNQPSADEQSPQRQPGQAHLVRSFTLPNRIHPSNVDDAQVPPPTSTKIRRNFSKKIITEVFTRPTTTHFSSRIVCTCRYVGG